MNTTCKMMLSITFLFIFISIRCDDAKHPLPSPNDKLSVIDTQTVHQESTILIDTTLESIGNFQVIYEASKDELWVKSWTNNDTIYGSTDWALLRDSVIDKVRSVFDIGYIDKNGLKWTNVFYTKKGTLFFSIFDQWRRGNVYAIHKHENKWRFICEADGTCPVFYTTSSCKVLDDKRDRLLVKTPGVDYDTSEDRDIQTIRVIGYGEKRRIELGKLKLSDWEMEQCDSNAIVKWFEAYSNIAGKKGFDFYLDIPIEAEQKKD